MTPAKPAAWRLPPGRRSTSHHTPQRPAQTRMATEKIGPSLVCRQQRHPRWATYSGWFKPSILKRMSDYPSSRPAPCTEQEDRLRSGAPQNRSVTHSDRRPDSAAPSARDGKNEIHVEEWPCITCKRQCGPLAREERRYLRRQRTNLTVDNVISRSRLNGNLSVKRQYALFFPARQRHHRLYRHGGQRQRPKLVHVHGHLGKNVVRMPPSSYLPPPTIACRVRRRHR